MERRVVTALFVDVVGSTALIVQLGPERFKRALDQAFSGLREIIEGEGGSVGTSLAQIVHQRREQFHTLRLNEGLDALNPVVGEWLQRAQELFTRFTGDAPRSHLMALQSLDHLRERQALSLAFLDVFVVLSVISILLVLLVPLMRRSVAEKGTPIGAE